MLRGAWANELLVRLASRDPDSVYCFASPLELPPLIVRGQRLSIVPFTLRSRIRPGDVVLVSLTACHDLVVVRAVKHHRVRIKTPYHRGWLSPSAVAGVLVGVHDASFDLTETP